MSSFTRNIIVAAIISLSGILATRLLYEHYDQLAGRQDRGDKQPVAKLTSSHNEVQRKAAKRVIWQRIDDEEPLYTGEAIRTSPDSEAKITFQSGAEVDLDPDSVIQIEEDQGKINLDFLKGQLFVKGGTQKDGSSITLQSGSTSIDLQDADMSLSKDENRKVDMQVYRGTASIASGGKELLLDKDKKGVIGDQGVEISTQLLKIKEPVPDAKVYIRIDKGELTRFSWSPLPLEFDVKLLLGAKRDGLLTIGNPVSAIIGVFETKLQPGSHYWQLVATDRKDPRHVLYSQINRLTVVPEIAPKLLSPVKDNTVLLSPGTPSVEVRWANPSKLVKLQLEVARDPRFEKTLFADEVEDTGVHNVPAQDEGVYYWRLSGFRPGSAVSLTSEAQSFTLRSKVQLLPPALKSPASALKISVDKVSGSGLFLSWGPVLGIGKYHLHMEAIGKNFRPIEKDIVDSSQTKVEHLEPGEYRWWVTSIDSEGTSSKPSEARVFIVEDLPKLLWPDGLDHESYEYVTPKPTLTVQWNGRQLGENQKNIRYKVTVVSEQKNPTDDVATGSPNYKPVAPVEKTMMTVGSRVMTDLPVDGVYKVLVEAVDASGAVVTKTSLRSVIVHEHPRLAPPHFSERMPAAMMASKNGTLVLAWDGVQGARSYLLELKSENGKILKHEKVVGTVMTLKGLLPGPYKVHVASTDEYGRVGGFGEDRTVTVPDRSDVRPPTFKKVNVR